MDTSASKVTPTPCKVRGCTKPKMDNSYSASAKLDGLCYDHAISVVGNTAMLSLAQIDAVKALYRATHDDTHGDMDFDDCLICDKLDGVIEAVLILVAVLTDTTET